MSLQIFWGSMVLGVCGVLQLVMIIGWAEVLVWYDSKRPKPNFFSAKIIPIGGTFALFVFTHTLCVWIWAAAFLKLGALSVTKDAIYFSLVTYTTVGYGDVILGNDFKIFGAMASVSGLLNFGVSTAFLLAVLAKILPNHLSKN